MSCTTRHHIISYPFMSDHSRKVLVMRVMPTQSDNQRQFHFIFYSMRSHSLGPFSSLNSQSTHASGNLHCGAYSPISNKLQEKTQAIGDHHLFGRAAWSKRQFLRFSGLWQVTCRMAEEADIPVTTMCVQVAADIEGPYSSLRPQSKLRGWGGRWRMGGRTSALSPSQNLFQILFRQDLLLASLSCNILLTWRVMMYYHCQPISHPYFGAEVLRHRVKYVLSSWIAY